MSATGARQRVRELLAMLDEPTPAERDAMDPDAIAYRQWWQRQVEDTDLAEPLLLIAAELTRTERVHAVYAYQQDARTGLWGWHCHDCDVRSPCQHLDIDAARAAADSAGHLPRPFADELRAALDNNRDVQRAPDDVRRHRGSQGRSL